jgi:hypothetical protein
MKIKGKFKNYYFLTSAALVSLANSVPNEPAAPAELAAPAVPEAD